MSKVSTPLPKLDQILDGGFEDGSSVLVLADLVVDKVKFGASILSARLEEEDNGIYFIDNKLPKFAKGYIRNYDENQKNISFVDGFSSTIDKKSEEEYQLESKISEDKSKYIQESKEVISQAIEDKSGYGTTFIFDSLDSWVGYWDELSDFMTEVKSVMEDNNTVGYFLLPNLGFEEGEENELDNLKEMFDYVVHLKGLERVSGLVLKYIDIRKPQKDTKVPFEVTPSGITMYVPKILVTGPFNAGKSTTVQSLSDTAVSVDRMGTTIALDHGHVEKEGLSVDLFGTPGQKRFDWAMDFLGQSMFGCFLVVDSRNPNYERAKEMLRELRSEEVPAIVLANFQNKEGAIPPETIQEEMGIKTIGVDALHGEGLDGALEELFDKILSSHSWYYI